MPESSSIGTGRLARFMTASVARELGVLLALSVLFPFMIHIVPVPGDSQWGPRLLPMFYAPLLAALWGRVRSAAAVALLAPWLNWALTSHPSPRLALVMVVELSVFVVVVRMLLALVGPRWYLAAPAFFASMATAALVAGLFPALIGGLPALAWAAQSVVTGEPGIVILLAINWLALRYYPPGAASA